MLAPHAILTGDLIGSTRAPAFALERAMAVLSQTTDALHRGGSASHRFTRFRGDGWQIALARPELCFRAATCLAAALRAADTGLATRMAIGIGPVETLGTIDLSDGRGAGFVTSGRLLDRMDRKERIRMDGAGVTDMDQAIIGMIAWFTAKWSRQQAEAVSLVTLKRPDADGPAQAGHRPAPLAHETLGITRQALAARLAGAGFHPLHALITARETLAAVPEAPTP